ncbi:MAG: hypothetical protein J6I53_00690 [Treponema sp.]|nr:hypothetical protein [Treponema sp.]
MKKPITLISIICSMLFVIAIAVFASGIYIDKKEGSQRADARYETFLAKTRENFSKNPFGTPEFSNSFIRDIGNIADFSSLKLEVNGTLVYSYPPETFSLPSPELVKSYSDSDIISQTHFTVRASIYLMTPNTVYNHSRVAFLLILIGTLLIGIFIVFTGGNDEETSYDYPSKKRRTCKEYSRLTKEDDSESENSHTTPAIPQEVREEESTEALHEKETELVQENTTEEQATATPESVTISFGDDYIHSEQKSEPESQEKEESIFNPEDFEQPAEEAEDESKSQTKPLFEEESVSIDFPDDMPVFTEVDEKEWTENSSDTAGENALTAEDPHRDDETEISEDDFDIIDQMEQENKSFSEDDLFDDAQAEFEEPAIEAPESKDAERSPITDLYVQSALDGKLDEAISTEPETTLALIKISGLDRGNTISQNIISIIRKSADTNLLFEYKADSYAAIVPKDLQESVDCFEKIYNMIAEYLKDNNAVNEVSAGISSANGRKITAERLKLEADQALDYASQDPDSPIVAFRANPQKYQEYLDSNEG